MLSPDEITEYLAKTYSLTSDILHSRNRNKSVSEARALAEYFIHRRSRRSKAEIGRYFNRCHTTVLHSYNSIIDRRKNDMSFRSLITTLEHGLDKIEQIKRINDE